MVEVIKLKTKAGELLTTKEGKQLYDCKLQVGDEFIPEINKVLVRENNVIDDKGKKVIYTNYSIPAKVRDSNGKTFKLENEEIVYLALTPGQSKVLNRLKLEDVELNQNLFNCYEYTNDKGTFIGVGIKGKFKQAKSFKDFESDEE